ncbi:nucleotide sugar dehydrogenase [Patescibacteria group bacterium]|nr:nucleotide sugar dehydrogenase [Patescibacteria group bacterium]
MKICIVGLGYVGLPLASLLSKHYKVLGFDVSQKRIDELKKGIDVTDEVPDISKFDIEYTIDEKKIKEAEFIIITVPTPIDDNNQPDLSLVMSATEIVGRNLSEGAIVVYESTVYPGCTEEICVPILEQESGLKFGKNFGVGYSPERVNPGDKEHTIDKIYKVISGDSSKTLKIVDEVYSKLTKTHSASSIKVAEAAKVIENIQRDLNIALVNELSLIFDRMGIDTKEVIEAAGTKWNFNKYFPGLVGGHCIPVDPYYLTYKATQLDYNPKVILAGREINNYMPKHVVRQIVTMISDADKVVSKSKILVMGLTFKENVPDTRNSRAKEIITGLKQVKADVVGYDPLIEDDYINNSFEVNTTKWPPEDSFDCIILFSPHDEFKKIKLEDLKNISNKNPILYDVKGFYDKAQAKQLGFAYKTL